MVITLSDFGAGIKVSVLISLAEGGERMAQDFAKAFYDSAAWKKVRTYVLMRDHYTCTRCPAPAEEVHHIIRLSPDNMWNTKITLNPDNLISLCKDCHFKEHELEKIKGTKRANGKTYGDCREGFHFDKNGMLVPDAPRN